MSHTDHAHSRLRDATRPLHEMLDARLDVSSLSDRDAYVKYLLANRPCCEIEQGLEAAGVNRVLPDWAQRRRRFALDADLESFGVHLPPVPPYPIDLDIGTVLGWCYVLEGSRLGAQVILCNVEASLDDDVRHATRFLRHGIGRALWASFKTILAQIDDDESCIARACSAASAAFNRFLLA